MSHGGGPSAEPGNRLRSCVNLFPSVDALMDAVVEGIVAAAAAAITAHGRFVIALAGGKTPRALHERLAAPAVAARIDWSRVHVCWGDERCVPPADPQSNFRMACETLLDRVPIPPSHIHRIAGEDNPRVAAVDYEVRLRALFPEGGARFDLVLLGMGDNGHTASLFPGLTAVREAVRWVVAEYVPEVGMSRVSLTPVAINAAAAVWVVVTGAEKAAMLKSVTEGDLDPDTYPVQSIWPTTGTMKWFVDGDAGRDSRRDRVLPAT